MNFIKESFHQTTFKKTGYFTFFDAKPVIQNQNKYFNNLQNQ
jgi:hypothetical protein